MSSFISAATYQLIWPDAAGTTYTMGVALGLRHESLDGTGTPPVNRKYTGYVASDGGYDDGFQLDLRRMTWRIHISAANETAFDTARALLYTVFRPLRDPYRLKVTRADGAVRQIDCYVDGAIEVELGNGFTAIATIPLVAPNPLWYNPTPVVVTLNTWPATQIVVIYSGTWYEWPIIKVSGSIVDLQLLNNVQTGATFGVRTGWIDMRPNSVPAAEYYIFDTTPGKKTVVDSTGASVFNAALTVFDRYPEFRLWPEPQKAGGTNTIAVAHGATGAGAAVEITYYNRYIGL